MKRYTRVGRALVECDGGDVILAIDHYDDYASFLAVLRKCVEALERCDKHFQHGAGYVCDALCAAKAKLEEEEA